MSGALPVRQHLDPFRRMNMVALFRDGRWKGWSPTADREAADVPRPGSAVVLTDQGATGLQPEDLKKGIGTTAFAYCGYDTSNLGRSPELLEHPVYGPLVREVLREASEICSEALGRRIDLAARITTRIASSVENFPADVAMIVAMEIAQVRLLQTVFDVPVHQARLSFGFSLGEVTALVAGGVFQLGQVLSVLLPFAKDCVGLAAGTSMGVLFTRARALPMRDVRRLCLIINSQGQGLIGPSAFLSPNAVLLIGQGDTLDRFEAEMNRQFAGTATLRRHPTSWPPLHTPLVWQRNIPTRLALALFHVESSLRPPTPTVVSCVTGEATYDELNSRELLVQWTDHPQRLWAVIQETLASPAHLVIHVGPEPKLIPTTFHRLSNAIAKYLGQRTVKLMRNSMIPSMSQSAWLTRFLPSGAASWRAPFVKHLILEDWLLDQRIP